MSGSSQTSKVYSRQRVLSSKSHCCEKCYKTTGKLNCFSFWIWLKALWVRPFEFSEQFSMLWLCYVGLINDLNVGIYNLLTNISHKIVLYDEFLWEKDPIFKRLWSSPLVKKLIYFFSRSFELHMLQFTLSIFFWIKKKSQFIIFLVAGFHTVWWHGMLALLMASGRY